MDDRVAKLLLENNILVKQRKVEDRVALLEKLSTTSPTTTPGEPIPGTTVINNNTTIVENSTVISFIGYLNSIASDFSPHLSISENWSNVVGGSVAEACLAVDGYKLLKTFSLRKAGGTITINGVFAFAGSFKSSVVQQAVLKIALYKMDEFGTKTLLAEPSVVLPLTTDVSVGFIKEQMSIADGFYIPLSAEDRFTLEVYVAVVSDATITFYYGTEANPSFLALPNYPPIVSDGIVPFENVKTKTTQNLVSNGAFETADDWTLDAGWSITGGKLVGNLSSGGQAKIFLDMICGVEYRITFDAIVTSGLVIAGAGGITFSDITTSGTKTFLFTPTYPSTLGGGALARAYITFQSDNFIGSIDNLTVTIEAETDLVEVLNTKIIEAPTDGVYYIRYQSSWVGLHAPTGVLSAGEFAGLLDYATSGSALAVGDIVYLTSSNRWVKTNASSSTSSRNKLGICLNACAFADEPFTVLLQGIFNGSGIFPSMTTGDSMYLSTTDGDIANAPPYANPGEIIRSVGHALNATELSFNPSNDYFEIGYL